LRGFARCLAPELPPADVGAARRRTGARRRASRQMNSEIPPRMITAPAAIAIALLPLRPLPPEAVVLVVGATTGAVGIAGVVADGGGTPGDSGLPGP
jgi:hypothetical protein